MQFVLIQFRNVRFKERELVKLRDGAGHHETATRVMMAELVLVRNDVAVLIRKHGPVSERERVAIIIEPVGRSGASRRHRQKNYRNAGPRSTVTGAHH